METNLLSTLLLPWFPIVLAVGVGGRLLGRVHGLVMGFFCALFWIVLVQASAGVRIWEDPWSVATIVTGALAIAAMGGWSGERSLETPIQDATNSGSAGDVTRLWPEERDTALEQLSAAIDQFDEWLEEHRNDDSPWARFDEFVRSMLYGCCKATHVRPYRITGGGEELIALREVDESIDVEPLSARRGIVGHVVTTGRSYVLGDVTQGDLVDKLAEESLEPIVWSFPIRQGTRRLGVVVVGQLDVTPQHCQLPLRCAEKLINQFWRTLVETVRSRSASKADPVSGLPSRPQFLHAAEQSLSEAYRQGEPAAVAVIALEGLRELSDSGRWEAADELVREASALLRRKVRTDDRLGRFDGSRLILLLRRVDSELASLIVRQIMSRLTALCGDEGRWRTTITPRCGVAGSGMEEPDLPTLVTQALGAYRRARMDGTAIAKDLETAVAVGENVG
jgi:diguanylate cyclase (GGDEF)-like protein